MGNLSFKGKQLAISIRINKSEDSAWFSMPENLQLDVPFDKLRIHGDSIFFSVTGGSTPLKIRALRTSNNLSGKLSGELPATMSLMRSNRLAETTYSSMDTVIMSGNLKLRATITLPHDAHNAPAVIFISGTGDHKKEELNGFADFFAKQGIASVRFDKRNVTDTTGKGLDYVNSDIVTFSELLRDAEEAFDLAVKMPGIDPKRIGFMGFSLGAVEVPVLAVRTGDCAFAIAVSGNATTDEAFSRFQVLEKLKKQGANAAVLKQAEELNNVLYDFIRTGKSADLLNTKLKAAHAAGWGRGLYPLTAPGAAERKLLLGYNNIDFDPAPFWKKVAVPTLAVYGGRDVYVPALQSIEILRSAFASRPQLLTVKYYDAADHTLRTVPRAAQFDFPRISADYLRDLKIWLKDNILK